MLMPDEVDGDDGEDVTKMITMTMLMTMRAKI